MRGREGGSERKGGRGYMQCVSVCTISRWLVRLYSSSCEVTVNVIMHIRTIMYSHHLPNFALRAHAFGELFISQHHMHF